MSWALAGRHSTVMKSMQKKGKRGEGAIGAVGKQLATERREIQDNSVGIAKFRLGRGPTREVCHE